MTDEKSRAPATSAETRQRRMAEALRANLRRRKEQTRELAGTPSTPDKKREG